MSKAVRNISLVHRKSEKMTVIIPAAGVGKRMKYCGAKALIHIKENVTLLEHQLSVINKVYPNAEVIVTIGFESEKFLKIFRRRFGVRFVFNPNYVDNNVLASVSLAMYAMSGSSVLLIYGDLYFDDNAIKNIANGKSRALVDCENVSREHEVGVVSQDGVCTNFAFGLNDKWGQIVFISQAELPLLERTAFNSDNVNWFGYEALNYIIEHGGTIEAFKPKKFTLLEIDTPKDAEDVRKVANDY